MIKLKDLLNEVKFKSPDYIISTTPASSLPAQKLGHADVSVGLKMAEKLKNYTLHVRHYKLVHADGKVALKLTPEGKTAVRVRTEDDPKYLQLIQKTVNDVVADYVSKIKESVNEDKVYIDFLNKKKGFKQDRIKFNSYEDAVKWAKKNFDKFNPDMIKYESVNEAQAKYDVYHNSYTSAIQSAKEYAEKNGYTVSDDDSFRKIGMGPKRPSEGKTNSFSIELSYGGKDSRKQLHIQVYGMRNNYELNCYIG